MKTPDLTPAASIKIVQAALIWIALFSAEIGAGTLLRNFSGSIEYYYLAISLGCFFCILLPVLGDDPMVLDVQELCLYDIFAMTIGAILFKMGESSTVYLGLAQMIIILQGMRLLWPVFNYKFTNQGWPPFGILGLYRKFCKKYDPARQPVQAPGWLYPVLICTSVSMYWITQTPMIRNLPMREILTLVFVFGGGGALITRLTRLESERLDAIRVMAVAQAEADFAKREAEFATARLKDQQIIEAQNAELATKNTQLGASNRRLGQLNATLKNRNAELQALYEERDQMAQTLAARNDRLGDDIHDQKNNTIVMSFRAKELRDSAVDENQRETSTLLFDEIADLSRKLMGILRAAKLENHFPKPPGKQIIAAKSFCHYLFERLNPVALQYEVTLRCRTPQSDEPLAIETDEDIFKRIVINLLLNAIKYAGPNREACITFYGGPDGCYVHVYDTGPGMEGLDGPDRVENFDILTERVAKAYVERENQRTDPLDPTNGNGVGLLNVQRLCYDLGVTIKLRSKLGRGTDFCLKFPLAVPELPTEN